MEATKVCSKCGVEKVLGEFGKITWNIRNECKKIYYKKYHKKNKNQAKRLYLLKSKQIRERMKEYQEKNIKILSVYNKEYKKKNRVKINIREMGSVGYVKRMMLRQGIENPTPEQIENKREQLELKRAFKQFKEVIKNGTDATRD